MDGTPMAFEAQCFIPGGRGYDSDHVVVAPGCNPATVRTESYTCEPLLVAAKRINLPAVGRIPDFESLIGTGAGEPLAIRAERKTDDRVTVSRNGPDLFSRARVHEGYDPPPATRQAISVRTECTGVEPLARDRQRKKGLTGLSIPQLDFTRSVAGLTMVARTPAGNPRAFRTEGHDLDRKRMTCQGKCRRAGAHIPNLDQSVFAPRNQTPAFWTDAQAIDAAVVCDHRVSLPFRVDVPKPDGAIVTSASHGAAIGERCDLINHLGVIV